MNSSLDVQMKVITKTLAFFGGLVMGLLLATASNLVTKEPPPITPVARVVGDDGYLYGWTVEVDGEEVCSDPYVYVSSKVLSC